MERFKLDKYLKDTSRKVVTRDGRNVRIVCTDVKDSTPIVAVIEKEDKTENVFCYESDGIMHGYHDIDLFFAPEKKEGYVPLFRQTTGINAGFVFNTKEEAEKSAKSLPNYITTTKIEWEE